MATTSIEQILATRARTSFSYKITFEQVLLTNIPQMEDWCREYCQDLWRNHTFYMIYGLCWQFSDEKDATMFMLRWSSVEGNHLK